MIVVQYRAIIMSHGSVLIGTQENLEWLSQQTQESARYTPDPFPSQRVGSGNETKWAVEAILLYLSSLVHKQ